VTILTNRNGKQEKIEVDMGAMLRNGDLSRNVTLEPGDTIFVQKAPLIYIYGEVQRAGAYPLAQNMTVMQALALGGGVTVSLAQDMHGKSLSFVMLGIDLHGKD